jgi:hypothetical protein
MGFLAGKNNIFVVFYWTENNKLLYSAIKKLPQIKNP